MAEEYVNVKLPKKLIEKVRAKIEEDRDLFEDETDYITHAVVFYHQKNGI